MNIISLTAVGLRLFALLIFFNLLKEVSRMVSLGTGFDSYDEWPIIGIFIVLFALVGLWLWRNAVGIAKKIVPKELPVVTDAVDDIGRPIYQLAFILLGIYVLIYGISDFFYTAQLYISLPDEFMPPDQAKKHQAFMVSSVIEVVIGFVLIIGAKGVSAVIYKVRYGGQ